MSADDGAAMEVRDRDSLFAHLFTTSKGDASKVRDSFCAYTPPASRLIIREAADFGKLGTTSEAVHRAADKGFWAYKDFAAVLDSFALSPSDPERRVMGIEGVGSTAELHAAVAGRAPKLKIGHLSLEMLEGKLDNGEWHWIDEANCVMHTATPKPAILRTELAERVGLELRVLRHEKFVEGEAEGEPVESVGDLIIFDIDVSDVTKPTGNTKVFCQNPGAYTISAYSSLPHRMRLGVDKLLAGAGFGPSNFDINVPSSAGG